jgi:hypothetical protein
MTATQQVEALAEQACRSEIGRWSGLAVLAAWSAAVFLGGGLLPRLRDA